MVEIGSSSLTVAIADTPELRSQGLRGVSDLGGLDGMLFVFDDPAPVWFTMQDTLIPLDLVVVSTEGRVVSVIGMVPCESKPCPLYPTGFTAAYTVEVPAGSASGVEIGATFSVKEG